MQIAELIYGVKKLQKPENLLKFSKPYHQRMKHFGENVKCAHFQVATWYSTVNQHPLILILHFMDWCVTKSTKSFVQLIYLKVYLLHHLKFLTQEKVTARPADLVLQRDVYVIQSEVSLK